MKIGGYFEIELRSGEEYHKDAICLNTGRNAFEYILRVNNYNKIYLPYYICASMLEPINKLNLEIEFYHIDKSFFPKFNFTDVQMDEAFVYTNYFGICDKQVKDITSLCKNLIIDNTQAFFSKPLPGVDTFYSARKFFGVPDGAYLYSQRLLETSLEQDVSIERTQHLLGRIDIGVEAFYDKFKNNSLALIGQPIKLMSKLTKRILAGIDYRVVSEKRRTNFIQIDDVLKDTNRLHPIINSDGVPLVYPYLIEGGEILKEKLIAKDIFVATYWPNVLNWVVEKDLEYDFVKDIVFLPIDQRYSTDQIQYMINIIRNEGNY